MLIRHDGNREDEQVNGYLSAKADGPDGAFLFAALHPSNIKYRMSVVRNRI